jgi:hypothetical protein
MPPGATTFTAWGVNNTDVIVGEAEVPVAGGYRGVRFQDGLFEYLSPIPGAPSSAAYAVNDEGIVVGVSYDPVNGPRESVYWLSAIPHVLELPAGPNRAPADVTSSGRIVGWMGSSPISNAQAFIWDSGVVLR